MNKLFVGALALTLLAGSAAAVSAQPYGGGQDHRDQAANNGRHQGWSADQGGNHQWKRGQRMGYNDWNGAHPVDYRQHHLRQPPRGYEWRESNGQYVLGALAGGLIASAIINSGR
jgi:Ni/Co efflux regulator RcnB